MDQRPRTRTTDHGPVTGDQHHGPRTMGIHAADTNARLQSEIDEITRQLIDVEQQLLAAQNANGEVTL